MIRKKKYLIKKKNYWNENNMFACSGERGCFEEITFWAHSLAGHRPPTNRQATAFAWASVLVLLVIVIVSYCIFSLRW